MHVDCFPMTHGGGYVFLLACIWSWSTTLPEVLDFKVKFVCLPLQCQLAWHRLLPAGVCVAVYCRAAADWSPGTWFYTVAEKALPEDTATAVYSCCRCSSAWG